MHAEEEDEAHLGDFGEWVGGPAQKTVERHFTLEGERESQEMQGQKGCQRQARKPMQQGGKPQCIAAMAAGAGSPPLQLPAIPHASTTAATAMRPRAASSRPKLHMPISSAAPRNPVHSAAMTRTPTAAWVAAVMTKAV